MFQLGSDKSRLKKKLTLFFILITVVSISVSIEMILELGSSSFKNAIKNNILTEMHVVPAEHIAKIDFVKIDSAISDPISDFRNRMIFVLLVICANIFVAFKMFTNDIVSPMEHIVEATKKIADGDLTVTVPVMSEDEIGQIAKLINDMNTNLSRMVIQIKQELDRHKEKIKQSSKTVSLISQENTKEMLEKKEIRLSDFKKMVKLNKDVVKLLESMLFDTDSLESFVNMYKTYTIDGSSNIRQSELDMILNSINKS
jgi:methyl-accepting chemotaxis protein